MKSAKKFYLVATADNWLMEKGFRPSVMFVSVEINYQLIIVSSQLIKCFNRYQP